MKVYGPYTRKDGRQHVIIINKTSRRTISYPRYLMEVSNFPLSDTDIVHHKDGNPLNNDFSNLEIKDRGLHAVHHLTKTTSTVCDWCGTDFSLSKNQRTKRVENRKKFCSKSCVGKYVRQLQLAA